MLTTLKSSAVSWEIRRALRVFRDTHERALERRFYRHLISKYAEGCIIDVGANNGSKTEIFRNLASPVVAIEPDPTSAALLRTRFKWRRGVVVRQCAIADKSGVIPFYQFGAGSAYNTADPEWATSMMDGSNHMHMKLAQPNEIYVQAQTLAEIEAEFSPVKYLKIDAEGFEKKVISTLRYPVPLISMEFNFPQMYDALWACVSHLETIGNYSFNAAITEPPFKLEYDQWLSSGEIIASIRSARWGYAEFENLTLIFLNNALTRAVSWRRPADRSDIFSAARFVLPFLIETSATMNASASE